MPMAQHTDSCRGSLPFQALATNTVRDQGRDDADQAGQQPAGR